MTYFILLIIIFSNMCVRTLKNTYCEAERVYNIFTIFVDFIL